MKISEFDYVLPKQYIAQQPSKKRERSKLMVLNRSNLTISHKHFFELPQLLNKGDILVLNDTKVIPAKLVGCKKTGGKIEVLLIKKIKENIWEILTNAKNGQEIIFENNIIGKIIGKTIEFNVNTEEVLFKIGKPPLPMYIKGERNFDKDRYQTIFAKHNGSIAAPTAGLHFTQELLDKIKERGIEVAFITLHIGIGTFMPIKTENIEDHKIEPEYFEIKEETTEKINNVKTKGGKIIACGTTVVRCLENLNEIKASQGMVNLFIKPPYKFKIVDKLITNFHLPKSTLLILVSTFAGKEFIQTAYKEAILNNYLFYSYGDSMLIL